MKVLQLTDCHVAGSPDEAYRGEDARASLQIVLDAAVAWEPDLVLATGDLSEDGSEASYAWLAGALGRFPCPLIATPGNHDDPDLFRAHFPGSAVHEPVVVERDWLIVVLGSAKPGQIGGRLDPTQLKSLRRALENNDRRRQRPVLVALHHQPWPVGSPWIDRYPLQDPQEFLETLGACATARLVLWGHVHQDVTLRHGALTGLGTPSTVSNSLPGRERFMKDPAGPACRWLELAPSGEFDTGILRPVDAGADSGD